MAVMLIVHGRLVYPIHGMRADTPEAAALVVMVFYSQLFRMRGNAAEQSDSVAP
jgi:hypothetical protein